MKEYKNSSPVFSEKINIVETTDPAHADLINEAPIKIFQNTLYNQRAIKELESRAGAIPGYGAEVAYEIGEYCLIDGVLYKCIKPTEGEWDPDCWEKTDTLGEIGAIKSELSGIKNPEFDDSGEVETIKSFPDFLETFISRMNLFHILRNLKAGLQFVIHREQVIDDCETEAEDLPLSAKQGKVLMEMHTKLIYIVIPASGWRGTGSDADDANEEDTTAPFENRVAVEGMREEDNVDITFVPMEDATNDENVAAWEAYTSINYYVTEDGALVCHALETMPEADVKIAIKGMAAGKGQNPEVPEEPDPETPDPETPDAPENQEDVEGG